MVKTLGNRRPALRKNRVRIAVESLEQRALLCDVTASLVGGVLTVTGGELADTIAVFVDSETQRVAVQGAGHVLDTFPADRVLSLKINTFEGDDSITLDPSLRMRSIIDGGDGTDTVVGWQGPDATIPSSISGEAILDPSACYGVECFTDITVDDMSHFLFNQVRPGSSSIQSVTRERSAGDLGIFIAGTDLGFDFSALGDHAGHLMTSTGFNSTVSSAVSPVLVGESEMNASGMLDYSDMSVADHSGSQEIGDGTMAGMAGMDAGAMDKSSHSIVTSSGDYSFATRSPYEGECPSSSSLGAAGIVAAAAPQDIGGEIANTQAGAPKMGCKCVGMRQKVEVSKAAEASSATPQFAVGIVIPPKGDSKSSANGTAVTAPSRSCCSKETGFELGVDIGLPETDDNNSAESVDQVLSTFRLDDSDEHPTEEPMAIGLGLRLGLGALGTLAIGSMFVQTKQRRRDEASILNESNWVLPELN